MDNNILSELNHVISSLNYTAEMPEKPAHYLYEPPDGIKKNLPERDFHEMPIYDSRGIVQDLSLDKQGFMLTHQTSEVKNFYDPEEVKAVYFPEVEQLVKEITGASTVLVFDHNVRCGSKEEAKKKNAARPVRYVHNDYTLKSGPQRLQDLVGDAEAERLSKQRYAVINVWRPIKGPIQEMPFAVCNAETMSMADFIPTDLKYEDRTGEIYSIRFNPKHQWFYFSQMEHEEVMLLKCYDSAEDGRARFTAHSAFKDPNSSPDAPPRESIEVRTMAFFESDA